MTFNIANSIIVFEIQYTEETNTDCEYILVLVAKAV